MIFKININIEDKIKYEFVEIENEKYVILTEYDDKILAVQYKIEEIEGNVQYTFETGRYCFFDRYQGNHWYASIQYTPVINKEN